MQTFLPLPHIPSTAQVLDRQRLGKQRSEAKVILNILLGQESTWANHPAVRMWVGYETALATYGLMICAEWVNRGYKDSLIPFFSKHVNQLSKKRGFKMPPWFGKPDIHASHRAALLAKNFNHYSQFGWTETPVIAYVWPVPLIGRPHDQNRANGPTLA